MLGFTFPDSGSIELNGLKIEGEHEYRRSFGYMPQISRFPSHMRVISIFDLIKKLRPDVSPADYDLSLFHDYDLASISHMQLGQLSGGMRQQVSASLAFLLNPSVIILDEPTAGLDPLSNQILKDKINRIRNSEDRVILTTSHNLHDLEEICDRVIYLMKGRIVIDEPVERLKARTSEGTLQGVVVSMLKDL